LGTFQGPIHPVLAGQCLQMKKENLERYLAEGLSLEQIGERVGREKSTISYHLKRHGLKPVGARYANKGALPKDVLEAMVDKELPLSEMARQLDRNISSVRHWLIKYGLWPLPSGKRRAEARCARELGLKRVEMDCHHHGRTEFILEGRGSYRCMKCRREAVIRWRRNAKLRLVKDAGGRCQLCGFDEFPGALQFHHLDPRKKSFGLAMRGLTRSIGELRKEAAKCILLCANCHAKVEWGSATIPHSALNDGSRARGKLNDAA
jgi:5-methylcytosine-specific restriction endonuclease McrA/DNA-binding transcriptional ArsR family regulator